MDINNISALNMKRYALKLVNLIQEKNNNIINSQDYVWLLKDLHSNLAEYQPACGYLNTEPECIRSYIKQLLGTANFAKKLKDEEFSHITLDFNKLIVI